MQGGLVLESMGHFSLLQGHFWIDEILHDFLLYYYFFKMKLKNFLVASFVSGIGLVIEFLHQSAFTEILKSFLKTN